MNLPLVAARSCAAMPRRRPSDHMEARRSDGRGGADGTDSSAAHRRRRPRAGIRSRPSRPCGFPLSTSPVVAPRNDEPHDACRPPRADIIPSHARAMTNKHPRHSGSRLGVSRLVRTLGTGSFRRSTRRIGPQNRAGLAPAKQCRPSVSRPLPAGTPTGREDSQARSTGRCTGYGGCSGSNGRRYPDADAPARRAAARLTRRENLLD